MYLYINIYIHTYIFPLYIALEIFKILNFKIYKSNKIFLKFTNLSGSEIAHEYSNANTFQKKIQFLLNEKCASAFRNMV